MSGSDPIRGENEGSAPFDAAFDEAFDAELTSMFKAAGPPAQDPDFTARVVAEAGRTSRLRFIALGGAGVAGAAVAATQLGRLAEISGDMGGVLGQAAAYAGPEALVMLAFAGIALAFARVLPGGRLA